MRHDQAFSRPDQFAEASRRVKDESLFKFASVGNLMSSGLLSLLVEEEDLGEDLASLSRKKRGRQNFSSHLTDPTARLDCISLLRLYLGT